MNRYILKDLVDFKNGYAFKSKFFSNSDGIPLIRIRDIKNSTTKTYYLGEYDDNFIVKNGDFLIGMDGNFEIAQWKGKDSLLNQRVCTFKIKDNNLNEKYLYYFLKIKLKQIEDVTGYTTVKHLSITTLKNIVIETPDLLEQEKIVERLDKVFENIDHKMSIYEDEVKRIDKLFNSTIHSIFVQGEDGYSEVFLKDIAEYFNGLTYSPTDKSDSGTVVLRSSNVQNNELDFKDIVRVSKNIKEKLFVQNGDVLICSRNGSKRLIGKSAEIKDLPEPMTFGTFMMIVRSDKNNYLKWFFKSSVFKQQISSGENTMINQITRYMLDEIKLQLPNEKVQKEIDNKLTKLYKACEDLRQNINLKLYKCALLKKAILNKEFTYE